MFFFFKSLILPSYFLLKSFCVNVFFFNKRVKINAFAKIVGHCNYGLNVKVQGGVFLNSVSLGDYTYIAQSSYVSHAKIGRFCSIANNVMIGLPSHQLRQISTHPLFETKDFNSIVTTSIDDNVWIGAGSIILSGVKVGSGSVIGAGSIVTKNVNENSIVAGVPAKEIGKRLAEDEHKAMVEIFKKPTEFIIRDCL
ncbi:chloramphenicol acetyltransferase [Vibrio cholerae]|uniref:CatB-related O-acetyltransferase n=1 Tax=Vibrio cholerae TaxID=666 RepID=UPI00070BF2DE|nr:CatB-related O-acetyltransferase [Vibrio cholerae]EHY0936335.1 CatB-related O-acetyltransferase [Vibrio cholerae]EJL6597561.1 CatB-related O-acetyltransferase [Vibrio cholerae]EJL6615621.1 CatB-related O-acetyltransferase [Vibrio cholerae]PAS07951.1 chloramphenicol acetyltransferase [Vibrio cholerae]PAS15293.1 chloramphenicol acetyltransferase [Vibrio cholerae]